MGSSESQEKKDPGVQKENVSAKLLRAAELGDAARVKELLQMEGVDPHYFEKTFNWKKKNDPRGKTSLVVACQEGHVEVARVILDHGGETQGELETAFSLGALNGHLELVNFLMERGVDPSCDHNAAFVQAASAGRCQVLQVLLKDPRVDVAADNHRALRRAVQHGHTDAVKLFLADSARFDPSICGKEFTDAAQFGHYDTVALLLADGRVDPNTTKNTGACAQAARCGHFDLVRLLLADPRVDARWGILTVAVSQGLAGLKMLDFLLAHPRIDPAAEDNAAVVVAAESARWENLKRLLLDPRVDPSAQNNRCVRSAAANGYTQKLLLLLADARVDATGAIPNARDSGVHILLEDERFGIHVNRKIFEQYHMREVKIYERLAEHRAARICAASWCMKQIGMGWGDVRELLEERMQKERLDWCQARILRF